ncbi:unnamed protein product, partial [Phaeothamnion confervicola]
FWGIILHSCTVSLSPAISTSYSMLLVVLVGIWQKGHIDAVLALIESGADVNARSSRSNTPLHYASFFGRYPIVRLLLKKGADKTLRNANGKIP